MVFEGTILETLLINRLNGTFAGPVSCLVTTDIYSHDRQHVLIPAGTKVLGEAKKVEAFGQQRLAVFFHRLIMPDGYSVSLDQFKGLNQIGETALRDKVNNHYLQIFGASLAVGILGGIAEAGTGNAFTNSPLDRARAGFGCKPRELVDADSRPFSEHPAHGDDPRRQSREGLSVGRFVIARLCPAHHAA